MNWQQEAEILRAQLADTLAALQEEAVRKSAAVAEVVDLSQEAQDLRLQVVKCAEETQKACAEATQYKEWFTRAEEELQETRARANKAEADLASCLAATNEALEEALTHGREVQACGKERHHASWGLGGRCGFVPNHPGPCSWEAKR